MIGDTNSGQPLPALDGLRGIAIMLVMGYHFGGILPWGWIGVDLFFVLSGFLITRVLIARPLNIKSLLIFYWNRIVRILPACYLVLFIFFVMGGWLFNDMQTASYVALQNEQIHYWLFNVDIVDAVKGWPDMIYLIHFWSLSVEMKFYLLWPLIWWNYRYNSSNILLYAGVLLVIAFLSVWFRINAATYWQLNDVYRYTFFLSRLDSFALGSLGYLMYSRNKLSSFLLLLIGLVLAGILIFLIAWVADYWEGGLLEPFVWSGGSTVLAIAGISLLLWAVVGKGMLNRVLSTTVLMKMGKYSYGLYLYHNPVWLMVNKLDTPFWVKWVVSLGVSMLLSLFSFVFIERFFLKLKKTVFTPCRKPDS